MTVFTRILIIICVLRYSNLQDETVNKIFISVSSLPLHLNREMHLKFWRKLLCYGMPKTLRFQINEIYTTEVYLISVLLIGSTAKWRIGQFIHTVNQEKETIITWIILTAYYQRLSYEYLTSNSNLCLTQRLSVRLLLCLTVYCEYILFYWRLVYTQTTTECYISLESVWRGNLKKV